ncbi:ABC transporter permease [Sphingobacterium hungaricum]
MKTLKITFRQLWKRRLFTLLNIVGLSIGISSCWIIYQIVSYEFSYDKNLPNKEHIYKVISAMSKDGELNRMGGVSAPLYQGIQDEVDGVKNVVPVFAEGYNRLEIKSAKGENYVKEDPQNIIKTNSSYFKMLPYQWIAGDKSSALKNKENVVLSASRAKEYFPNIPYDQIINQTITYYGNDTIQRTVSGIVQDYPVPSEFTAKEFITLIDKTYEGYTWSNTNGSDKLYLEFENNAPLSSILNQINALSDKHIPDEIKEKIKKFNASKTYEFRQVNELHFATDIDDYDISKTSKKIMYILIGIGGFLLVLACINYINMSMAQIPQRNKEISVRKTLGSSQKNLIFQFLTETLITTSIAAILAIFLIQFGFWLLKDIIPEGVSSNYFSFKYLAFLLTVTVIITLVSGLYPSFLITKVKTIDVLKNKFSGASSAKKFTLQKALIVFQFVIAFVFIVCTIIVGSQLRYTIQGDLGFKKDAIILLNIPWRYMRDSQYEGKKNTLVNQLSKNAGIEKVSLGSNPLSDGYSSSPFEIANESDASKQVILYKKEIDTAYLDLYKMTLVAGNNISYSDTVNQFIINESAAKEFGFQNPEDALGKQLNQMGNPKFQIVGIVKDFHTQDFYSEIQPMVMMASGKYTNQINIKLNSHDPSSWQKTIAAIETEYKQFYPASTFSYKFYDEMLADLYKQERQINKLINLATVITVLISCLGLFGLTTLTVYQRTKEIGIRKVLGSNVAGIVTLLSKDYVKLIGIAGVIASPIAYWAMSKWLEDFAYRIDISWWIFLVAGLIAIGIALLTISYQALKAAFANPVDSLRDE